VHSTIKLALVIFCFTLVPFIWIWGMTTSFKAAFGAWWKFSLYLWGTILVAALIGGLSYLLS
jgi:hypothetical protein